MLIKTLLNKVERFMSLSFVYGTTRVMLIGGTEALVVDIAPRRNRRPIYPDAANAEPFMIVSRSDRLSMCQSGLMLWRWKRDFSFLTT